MSDYEAAMSHPAMAAYFGQEAVWALAARFSPEAYRWGPGRCPPTRQTRGPFERGHCGWSTTGLHA